MKKYILIIIVFIAFGKVNFAQRQNTTTKQTTQNKATNIAKKVETKEQPQTFKKADSTILKKIEEQRKILKAEKDKLSVDESINDKKFNQYKKMLMIKFWNKNPEWATAVGFHAFDSLLIVPTSKQLEDDSRFYSDQIIRIHTFNYDSLSDLNKIDYKILENAFNKYVWQISTLKSYEWNPSEYNVGSAFSDIIAENYAPLNRRINNFYARLKNVPEYYEAAKQNIKNPTKEFVELAITQNEGAISIFEKDFIDSLKTTGYTPAQQGEYLKRNKEAIAAIRSYIQFLKDFKNENPRSFRLGADLYAKKFEFDIQSQYSVNEIYQVALKRKEYLLKKMSELANEYWNKNMSSQTKPKSDLELIKKVIDVISLDHTTPQNFQSEIEKQLPELTAFVKEKNLIYMDPSKPLKVRKEPSYMAGVAGASMSSPGPYDKKGTAYYNVGSLQGWSAEKAESYLREYNKYTLQILNIHEAIPGHYVQLMYSNKAPSIIKSVFGNGAMIEGWAVYSELMMLENGYGNNSMEMWLMYYKWNLRSVCNTILDISVHTKNMSKEEAMNLLEKQAFQEKTEAENKWHRVQVSSVQLDSYFTGFYEITNLRDEYKAKQGANYSLKKFNESLLNFGSAPIKYTKDMILNNESINAQKPIRENNNIKSRTSDKGKYEIINNKKVEKK